MSETNGLENASKFNGGTSGDTNPSSPEIGAGNAKSGTNNGVFEGKRGDGDQAPATVSADGERTGSKHRGAPKGNVNNLRSGIYSKALQNAKTGKLKGSSRRRQLKTLEAVLRDQGSFDDMAVTLQFACDRFSRRVGRVAMMEAAVDDLLKRFGDRLTKNPKALHEIFDYLETVEDKALAVAHIIGFKQANASRSIAEQIKAIEQRETNGQIE